LLKNKNNDLSEEEKSELRKQIEEALSKSIMYYGRKDVPESVHILLSYYKELFKTYPREKNEEGETWEDYKRFLENEVNNKFKEKIFSDDEIK